MPVNDVAVVDERSLYVRLLFELAKDEDGNNPYAQIEADRQQAVSEAQAAAAAVQTYREHMREIATHKRRHVAKRPWQAAGYDKKANWIADGSPGPLSDEE